MATELRALIVDWGGVLTTGLDEVLNGWCDEDDLDFQQYVQVMSSWLGPEAGMDARYNPVHALERGEIEVPDFERELAARLVTRSGGPVRADGLVSRMFRRFQYVPTMTNVVRQARAAGLRTALLSNSWSTTDYVRDSWDELFDAVVISGEVRMRKPEPQIYRHTADLVGCRPEQCVFVDDLPNNVRGAVEVGMVGVHHTSFETTRDELRALFGMEGLGGLDG